MSKFLESAFVKKHFYLALRYLPHCAFVIFAIFDFSGCTLEQQNAGGTGTDLELQEQSRNILLRSFEAKGQAGLDRLIQDPTQKFCSAQRGSPSPDLKLANAGAAQERPADQMSSQNVEQTEEKLRLANAAQITAASDGNYFGDFKRGELIAQDGRGKTWTDPTESKNGGNCYNCHKLSKNEVSHGTLGPSLYQYGKLRGIKTVEIFTEKTKVAASDPVIQYTWGVLMNAKAYDLCTAMPRFGVAVGGVSGTQDLAHNTPILTQEQIKDLMSLLLDPRSPVNN